MDILQDLIEGLRIFMEYDSNSRIQILDGEIRITLLSSGIVLSEDDKVLLREFGWRYSEDDWVRWV